MAKLFGIALNFMAQTVARANCLRRLEKRDGERGVGEGVGVGCSDNLAAAFKIICLLIKYVFQFLSAALRLRCIWRQRVASRVAEQLIRIYVAAFVRGAFKFYVPCALHH